MKSFRSFLTEAPDCAEQSKFIWKGAVKSVAVGNFKDGVVWKGATQSVPLFNIKGGVMWEGVLQAKAIGNFKEGILWEGMVQEKALCNIRENTVWQGMLQAKAICNFGTADVPDAKPVCNQETVFVWREMVKSEAILNFNMKMSNHTKLAIAYTFVMKNSSPKVNKKTASGDKPKAVKITPKPNKVQASKA